MADDARQSPPDLSKTPSGNVAPLTGGATAPKAKKTKPRAAIPDAGNVAISEAYDFFELLRRLESGGQLFGHSGLAEREPARLGQHIRLSFATQDVAQFHPANETTRARVTVANIGLLGPEGPLPLHVTRWVLDRLSQRWFAGAEARETSDTTFVDFVNILQHRLMSLYYRAWADAHPAVQVERRVGGRVRSMLESLAGIGLPGTKNPENSALDMVKLRQAASLAQVVDGPERLTQFLAEAFNVPVQLKEFIATWIDIPKALQSQIGRAYASLGRGITIGPRIFSRQGRIEIRIGPVNLETYKGFLRDGERLPSLKRAVRDLIGEQYDVDLRVVLARDHVPPPKLGSVQLGRTTWLAPPEERGDAEDMRMRTIVGWRPELAGAAA